MRIFLLFLHCTFLITAGAGNDQWEEPEHVESPENTNDLSEPNQWGPNLLAVEELQQLHTTMEETLKRYSQETETLVTDLANQILVMMDEITAVREKEETLKERTQQLDAKIRQANVVQLNYFSQQLSDIVENELQIREEVDHIVPQVQVEDFTNAIYFEEFHRELDPEKTMRLSETEIENWLLAIGRDEIDLYEHQQSEQVMKTVVANHSKHSITKCVSPLEAAHVVHGAVMNFENDFIGMLDHAKGATIIHELTSDTFVPPPQSNEHMGNVWWRKYIPADWERVLPSGWEEWSVALPSEIQHALGMQGSATLPPEAILDPSTIPGSCWPMKGSTGHVTLRLPEPVTVKAVTIDHVSPLLLSSDMEVSSAPRKVRLTGYPPCLKECQGLGFNISRGFVLATIEFDKDGRHIQTYDINSGIDNSDCTESREIPGSCSAPPNFHVTAAPVQDSNKEVSGIKLEVLSNWGVDEYTCLYRLRVHGQVRQ